MKTLLNILQTGLLVSALALLSACSSSPTKEEAAVAQSPKELMFFDSKVFDQRLTDHLQEGSSKVNIKFEGDVNLNKLPDRIDTWIALINDKGGDVNIVKVDEQGLPSRGFAMDAIQLIYKGVDHLRKKKEYKVLENYDATLYYKADGSIHGILLDRK